MLKKIYRYQYIVYLFLFLVTIITLMSKHYTAEVDYSTVLKNANNILLQEPIGINYANDRSGINIPSGYDIQDIDNGFYLFNREAAISVYTGLAVDNANELETALNTDLEMLSKIQPSGSNGEYYLALWDYEMENSADEYLELVILKDDYFLSSIFPESKVQKYTSDSAYIFNSLREI